MNLAQEWLILIQVAQLAIGENLWWMQCSFTSARFAVGYDTEKMEKQCLEA